MARIISANADTVDGEWSGRVARNMAAELAASSGVIGPALREFANTGRADVEEFLADIARVRPAFRRNAAPASVFRHLDMLATFALNNPGEPPAEAE
jgi:hypothetical protein